MSKRAEKAIEAYYGNIPDDADKVKAARHFYEQAEKDTIERAVKWMKLHTYTFENMDEVDLYVDLFSKAMK